MRPSPDGKWVAYVLRSTDLEANRGRAPTSGWWASTERARASFTAAQRMGVPSEFLHFPGENQ